MRANGVDVYRVALRGVRVAAGSEVFYIRDDAQQECDFRNRREGRARMTEVDLRRRVAELEAAAQCRAVSPGGVRCQRRPFDHQGAHCASDAIGAFGWFDERSYQPQFGDAYEALPDPEVGY